MSRVPVLCLILGAFSVALPQATPDPFVIGVSVLRGKRTDCPLFVGGVLQHSPAARAGLEPGDVLEAVDGEPVNFEQALERITSQAAKPVTLTLRRGDNGTLMTVVVERELRSTIEHENGMQSVQDRVVPLDTTAKELECLRRFDGHRITGRVFQPTHYPENLNLYYPGFEAFMLDGPQQVSVGGIEEGPASDAGVRWGDILVSIDGVSVRGRTTSQLEHRLSSNGRRRMTLVVDRCGAARTFSFTLERAADILRRNQKQMVGGSVVPLGVPRKYLSCLM